MNIAADAKRPTRFLLIDDDDDHALLVRRTFDREETPTTLNRLADGEEALRYLRKEGEHADALTPDVVLLDLNLPRRSGHEILEDLKSDPVLRKIPVVVITSSDDAKDRGKAYEKYANSYLVKPIDFKQFRQMIHDLSQYWSVWNQMPGDES